MYENLSAETVRELVGTLQYLKDEFDRGFQIDAINMAHVDKALARVQIERSFARQARIADVIPDTMPLAAE